MEGEISLLTMAMTSKKSAGNDKQVHKAFTLIMANIQKSFPLSMADMSPNDFIGNDKYVHIIFPLVIADMSMRVFPLEMAGIYSTEYFYCKQRTFLLKFATNRHVNKTFPMALTDMSTKHFHWQ